MLEVGGTVAGLGLGLGGFGGGGCWLGVFGGVGALGFGCGGWGFADDFGGGFVFAEAEEGGLADEVVGGPGGEADLGDEGGADPVDGAVGILGDALEGAVMDAEFDELGEEIAAEFLGEAGAGASGVDEVSGGLGAALDGRVVAKEEGTDAVGAFAGEGEACDDEFLLVEAFGLEPVGGAGAAIGGVGALGEDAFGMEGAGLAEDGFAVAGNVFGEEDDFLVGFCGEEGGKELLALAEGKVAGIVAVEVEEVEDEVGEGMGFGVLEGGLEESEAGGAVGGEDDDFAIEGAVLDGESGDGVGYVGHTVGPVDALAGEELDFVAGLAGLDAVAVELELVDPLVACGGGGGFEGELRGDEVGLEFVWELVEVDGRERGRGRLGR